MTQARDERQRPLLGCIADDVTGATDLASNLVHGGMKVIQWMGVPDWGGACNRGRFPSVPASLGEVDAVVIAMKSRSIPAEQAVALSLAALRELRVIGCERFFFKYCSTFDSGPRGNIGPVAEALMDELGCELSVFCPAFPRNGRTVYQGHLFVGQQLLSQSGMENHPVNPMRDASVIRLLQAQATHSVALLGYETIQQGAAAIRQRLDHLLSRGDRLIVCDSCDDAQLATLAEGICHLPLVTGGSGVARHLPTAYRQLGRQTGTSLAAYPAAPRARGSSLILAGSCSLATRRQIDTMRPHSHPLQLDVLSLMDAPQPLLRDLSERALQRLVEDPDRPLLIYSSEDPEQVQSYQERFGGAEVSAAVEAAHATLARLLLNRGDVGQLIVAGGETSGAVAAALGIEALRIGPDICPGVPWSEAWLSGADRDAGEDTAREQSRLSVAFKSGNFGDDCFFQNALEMLR